MYIILIIYKYGSVYLRWREKKSLRRHQVFHDRTNYLDFCNEIVCQRYIGFQGAPSWILSKGLRLVSNDRQTDPILRCLFLRWLNSLLIYSPMLFIYPKLSQKKPNLKLLFIIIYIRPMQENICPGKDFIINFTMTLHHETWFKVTAYPLFKGTLHVKYKPDWTKGKEVMLRTSDLGRTDRLLQCKLLPFFV